MGVLDYAFPPLFSLYPQRKMEEEGALISQVIIFSPDLSVTDTILYVNTPKTTLKGETCGS
jgi:hypothetical protein